jgi:GMP synthase-like glutamine amidotransferase
LTQTNQSAPFAVKNKEQAYAYFGSSARGGGTPRYFSVFLARDGHSYDAVELGQGEALPDLDRYDALWVMGGPMDVWQEAAHPWLKLAKALIKDAVQRRKMPFLGLCLGHQLLAEALGGAVGKSAQPEVGVMDVSLTKAGSDTNRREC